MKFSVWDVIFWIFIVLATVLLIWRVFGNSPGIEVLIAAVIGSEAAIWKTMHRNWRLMYKHGRELAEIRKDVSYIKAKLN